MKVRLPFQRCVGCAREILLPASRADRLALIALESALSAVRAAVMTSRFDFLGLGSCGGGHGSILYVDACTGKILSPVDAVFGSPGKESPDC